MPTPSASPCRDETILIVDDTPDSIAALHEILSPHYKVRVANSGQRALDIVRASPQPDLVLLDVVMPDMDGFQVIRQLHEDPATQRIPVIFATVLDAAADEEKGLQLGAVDYLGKPLNAAVVLARVRTHLELKHARDRLLAENRSLSDEVARRARLHASILQSLGEGLCGLDAAGEIVFVNHAGASLLGYGEDELLGQHAHSLLHRCRDQCGLPPVEDCLLAKSLQGRLRLRQVNEIFCCRDGSPLSVELNSEPMVDADTHVGMVVTFQDIGERKRYLEEIALRSNFDALTGLPNRNLLNDRLTQAIERCAQENRRLAVMTLNIDRFKTINDSLGHRAGDDLLIVAARRMKSLGNGFDTLARTEGDEFVMLAEIDDSHNLPHVVQPLLNTLAQPFRVGEHEFYLTASVGVAVAPNDGPTAESLLQNSSAAMYRTKAVGGNGFSCYASEMNAQALERLALENGLRRAIERGELVLHYQPQLNLHSGKMIGCEALVRWRHPERGLVPPAEFIPLAESSGLIVPLGEWVLREACRQNRAWQQAGLPPVKVGVNLSARQLAVQDLVQLAADILAATELDPRWLELELTESAVLADADAFIRATEQLKGLSVTLSIDDFGTGFSSLSYLKRFAIDRLKIDQSFVRDLTQDPSSAAIAMTIISLAHSLGLDVIAEGVETEAQLNFLRLRHCDEMQGFYFSKPLPADQFAALLASGRTLGPPPGTGASGRSILLVDDEPSILSALNRLLRREGYSVFTAPGGAEGLEQLARHPIGVVISDARMPEMPGAEFLGRVRDMHPDTVRIMLSGYTDLESVTRAVNRGELYRFVTKPWVDAELLDIVRDAFHSYESRRTQRELSAQIVHDGRAPGA